MRISMATKLKNPRVVIDTLVQLKDRQRLLAFRSQYGTGSPADTHAEVVLRNPVSLLIIHPSIPIPTSLSTAKSFHIPLTKDYPLTHLKRTTQT